MVTAEYIIKSGITKLVAKRNLSVYEVVLRFPNAKGEVFSVYYDGDFFDGYDYDSLEEFLDEWDDTVYGTLEYV